MLRQFFLIGMILLLQSSICLADSFENKVVLTLSNQRGQIEDQVQQIEFSEIPEALIPRALTGGKVWFDRHDLSIHMSSVNDDVIIGYAKVPSLDLHVLKLTQTYQWIPNQNLLVRYYLVNSIENEHCDRTSSQVAMRRLEITKMSQFYIELLDNSFSLIQQTTTESLRFPFFCLE